MFVCNQQLHGGFYRKNEIEFLGRRINFAFATNKQLEEYAAKGIVLYNELYPPKPPKFLRKALGVTGKIGTVAVIGATGFMAVGAISVAASGLMVAAQPAVSGVAATVGASAGTATAASVATGTLATVQSAATYAAGAGLVYTAATGKPASDKLLSTASALESGNLTDAAVTIAKNELKDQNLKVKEGDEAAEAALRERIEREEQTYAGQLRLLAEEQRHFDGLNLEPKPDPNWLKYAGIAIPIGLFFLGK